MDAGAQGGEGGRTTFHVVPCTLDALRTPRGRGVDPGQKEFCKGFVRKKYVAIERGSDGLLLGTLPGGFKAKEVVELNVFERSGLEKMLMHCMRCDRPDTDHKQLRFSYQDLRGGQRLLCKNCSYCFGFCRIEVPDNNICEDCGCDASLHQTSSDDPIPQPQRAEKPPNASFKPGQRCSAVGTIVRAKEALDSAKITRLGPGTAVEVLELGTGPTGKRIRVRAEDGTEGWISVVSDTGVALLKPDQVAETDEVAPPAKPVREQERAAAPKPAESPQPHETIWDVMGKWGDDETPAQDEEDGGPSVADLLKAGGDFEVAAEELAATRVPTEVLEEQPAEEAEEPPVESLEELLRRLSADEEAEEQVEGSEAAGSQKEASRGHLEEEARRQQEEAEEERRRLESKAEEEKRVRQEREEQLRKEEEEEEERRRQERERRRREQQEERRREQREQRLRQEQEEEERRQEEAEHARREQEEEERKREEREQQEREDDQRLQREEERRRQEQAEEQRKREEAEAQEEQERKQELQEQLRQRKLEERARRNREWQARRQREEQEEELRRQEQLEEEARKEEELRRQQQLEEEARKAEEEEQMRQEEEEAAPRLEPDESPLACATRRRDLFHVQALLRDKADPNERNSVGETPLLEAAATGDVNVVALLLGWAADPRKRATTGVSDLGLKPEVRLLFKIFEDRKVDSEAKRNLLLSLDPGAHAEVRCKLWLGQKALALLQNRLTPASALVEPGTVLEFDATADHRVALHMADPVRPVLVLTPLWQQATATIVMLHGQFQSGRMFERLARDFSRALPHVRLLAPTALSQGCHFGVGPAWFGIDDMQSDLESAQQEIEHLLHLHPAEKVVILGFSAGGVLAAQVALRATERFAGLLLFGTPGAGWLSEGDWSGAQGLQVLQSHGGLDRMVKLEEARWSADRLRRSGCRVHFSLHSDVGHSISPSMVTEARAWLEQRLSDAPSEVASPSQAERAEGGTAAQVFDIGDDEGGDSGEGDDDDLDAMFNFASQEQKEPDLDAMYDFTAANTAALANEEKNMEPDLDAMYDFTAANTGALAEEPDLDAMYDFTAANKSAVEEAAAPAPDLDAMYDFTAANKSAVREEAAAPAPDLDAMYDFTAANKSAVREETAAPAPDLDEMYDFTAANKSALEQPAHHEPDLDAMYDFTSANNSALKQEAAPQEPMYNSNGVKEETAAPEAPDLDAMYDFTAVNNNALKEDTTPQDVVLEHAESGAELSLPVPATATIFQVKEAVAAYFSLDHSSTVQLLHCSDDEVRGRRQRLLLRGVDLRGPVAAAPLALAAKEGDVEAVKRLLRQGAAVDERDAAGETALFRAARGGFADVAAVLLLGKADPALRSQSGLLAADLREGPPAGTLLRLALGAKVSAREQRKAFASLEECTRFLLARRLERCGVRPAVRDVLSEVEWDAVCVH